MSDDLQSRPSPYTVTCCSCSPIGLLLTILLFLAVVWAWRLVF